MNKNHDFRKYAVNHLGMSGNLVDSYGNKIQNMTPYIIEERPNNFRPIDVFSRLIADRIIFLGMPVDDLVANLITAQLLYLESVDSKNDILMYINSPGGSVYDGLGVYDTMNYITPDVATLCTGLAASMAAVLLASGEKGKRGALKHSRIMVHQPMSAAWGQVSDMEIAMKETIEVKKDLYNIMVEATGQSYEQIEKDADRDRWMRSEDAKAYGIIDEVHIARPRRK
jgi:ATP-dependent Clp protease, protease subunit